MSFNLSESFSRFKKWVLDNRRTSAIIVAVVVGLMFLFMVIGTETDIFSSSSDNEITSRKPTTNNTEESSQVDVAYFDMSLENLCLTFNDGMESRGITLNYDDICDDGFQSLGSDVSVQFFFDDSKITMATVSSAEPSKNSHDKLVEVSLALAMILDNDHPWSDSSDEFISSTGIHLYDCDGLHCGTYDTDCASYMYSIFDGTMTFIISAK